jgi:hypothetical protein
MSMTSVQFGRARAATDHRAVAAWRNLESGRAALRSVHRLATKKGETTVHRLELADDEVVIAKRCRSEGAAVEAAVYEQVLPRLSAPTLRYYGKIDEVETDFSWIFVEEAVGSEYVADDPDHRAAAARWLAMLHTEASALDLARVLPERGVSYFRECSRAAYAAIAAGLSNAALAAADRTVLKAVLATAELLDNRWTAFERILGRVPSTVVHNDFSVDNLRVRRRDGKLVAIPFDWEDSGWGDPAVDLAQIFDHAAYSIRPDLAVYESEIRSFWPHLNGEDLRAVGELGSLFRILAELHWEAWRLSYEYQSARERAWLADYMTLGRDLLTRVDCVCLTAGRL